MSAQPDGPCGPLIPMLELTPDALRAFVHSWAVFVATERYPARAARLRTLERIVDAGEQDPTAAIAEIRAIRESAEAEAEAGL
ncbi:hypothetical protein ACFVXC_13715 [Streptomyces sp. NPDC058257]|uniref:hypothetical protein n=1 Tax=Streptomyces sp. NPDC058257 TaxID=3346409 RepID=UPI0036E16B31